MIFFAKKRTLSVFEKLNMSKQQCLIIYFFMNLFDEIEKFLTDTQISLNYKTINLGGKLLYVEGIKNIITFGCDEMQFQLKKQALKVTGKNLKIKYLDFSTCTIEGEIESVSTI